MLTLTRKLMAATEAVLDIALHGGEGPVQSSDLNARQGIPRRYLEPVLQQLVRAGVLAGVRGPRGGYRLARPPETVTLGDVARAVRDVEQGGDPLAEEPHSELARRVLRPVWADLTEAWVARLEATDLATLLADARAKGLGPPPPDALDYSI